MQLEIKQLTQQYTNGKVALDRLDLTLGTGITGLLGINGAGKSSLMRILATISRPSAGQVLWQGQDIVQQPDCLRQQLGYLPQSFGLYENLSAYEFLLYLAGLKHLPSQHAKSKVLQLLEMLNLMDVAKRPLGSYSGGMKQRVGIAQALLNDPKLLILDEPTVGLDPEERARLRDLLSELSGDRIIILSTHIVSDVESIADQIAMLNQGKLLDFATPEQLLAKISDSVWQCSVPAQQVAELRAHYCISHSVRQLDGFELRIVCKQQPVARARNVAPTLEDAFLYYGKSAPAAGNNLEQVA